jgi:excisionase family DNA binding protein
MLTTAQAADALGVTAARVRQLIRAGKLPAHRQGRDWAIDPRALARGTRDLGIPAQQRGDILGNRDQRRAVMDVLLDALPERGHQPEHAVDRDGRLHRFEALTLRVRQVAAQRHRVVDLGPGTPRGGALLD